MIEAKATAINETKAHVLDRIRDQRDAFSGMLRLLQLQRSELDRHRRLRYSPVGFVCALNSTISKRAGMTRDLGEAFDVHTDAEFKTRD